MVGAGVGIIEGYTVAKIVGAEYSPRDAIVDGTLGAVGAAAALMGASRYVQRASEARRATGTGIRIGIDARRAGHIFREAEGHIADAAEGTRLLEGLANNAANLVGTDARGNRWFASVADDGSQLWAVVRDGKIINGGRNETARTFNVQRGLSNPPPQQ